MQNNSFGIACQDLAAAVKRHALITLLAWQDIRQRYRRSALGPFWLTLSMSVMIGAIGLVFSQVFKAPVQDFLPFIAIGIILWTFISNIIIEGCTGFIAAENIIKQLPIPLFVHILRMVWRNVLILAHNIVIFPVVLIIVGKPLGQVALLSIPGFILATINLTWVALILATICTRYRDMPQMVASLIQVTFYLTPIIWMPKTISAHVSGYLLDLNPVFHLIEIMRAPLLGTMPTATNWLVSIAMAIIGSVLALAFYGSYRRRIPYWL
ncbi:ABC transporter permease [Methylotenera sp. G11]|uniref:ABC transporter permease n=1 Tax=Methylotenera sp. G11 TaxID=1506585 RepID=UPI000648AD30|nr:ABC transporter permease [Methylotenera sp. G11]